MIKKFLLLRLSITPYFNPDSFKKVFLLFDLFLKTIKKWNQMNFKYFNSHFDKTYNKG